MSFICGNCINSKAIKEKVENDGVLQECMYCQKTLKGMPYEELLNFASDNLQNALIPFSKVSEYEQAGFYERFGSLDFFGMWALVQNLEVGPEDFEEALADLTLNKMNGDDDLFTFDDGAHEVNCYDEKWDDFIQTISHSHRFFNNSAKEFLDSLFEAIFDSKGIKTELIATVTESDSLFRARIANSMSEREIIVADPAAQLGTVPCHLASEQRMTPQGIAALYASFERTTCFSEIRAIAGDVIISGEFKAKAPLRLLDLTKFHEMNEMIVEPFDSNYRDISHKSVFIKKLALLMSKPATESNSSSYLSTQVIFEYLRVRSKGTINGLKFSSVQAGVAGTNVVLFPEYSSIRKLDNSAAKSTEHYFDRIPDCEHYRYRLEAKSTKTIVTKPNDGTLEFVEGSLKIDHVQSVHTKTKQNDVIINFHKKKSFAP